MARRAGVATITEKLAELVRALGLPAGKEIGDEPLELIGLLRFLIEKQSDSKQAAATRRAKDQLTRERRERRQGGIEHENEIRLLEARIAEKDREINDLGEQIHSKNLKLAARWDDNDRILRELAVARGQVSNLELNIQLHQRLAKALLQGAAVNLPLNVKIECKVKDRVLRYFVQDNAGENLGEPEGYEHAFSAVSVASDFIVKPGPHTVVLYEPYPLENCW